MTLSALLNVNKPTGWTSRAVVDRVERIVRPAKAGHAGTLDPLASGVLVICVGQATRLIQYVQRMPKHYLATFLLGHRSATDDTEGELVPVLSAIAPTRETLDLALKQFKGDILQRPPAHSAVKLAGRRAYDLARRGIETELQPRTVTIHEIAVRHYSYPELQLEVKCGSGTYIRALGRDLGEVLETGAVMSALERTAIGAFNIADAVSPDDLSEASLPHHVLPALVALPDLPRIPLTPAQLLEVRNGRPIMSAWLSEADSTKAEAAEIAAVDSDGSLAAILYPKLPGELWPRTNFS